MVLFPLSLFAQIDYQRGVEFISTEKPEVHITWIKEASKDVPLYFDQQVGFVNTKSDQLLPSRVEVIIFHNGRYVHSFEFKVGENLVGHIYMNEPIKLKKGDNVSLFFKLKSTIEDESYVFSIFDQHLNKSAPDKSVRMKSYQKKTIIIRNKPMKKAVMSNDLKRIRRNRTALALLNIISH